jgi:hypothetical protein
MSLLASVSRRFKVKHTKTLIKEAMRDGMRRPRHIQRWILTQNTDPVESDARLRLRKALEINKVEAQLQAMVQLGEAVREVRTVSRGRNGNMKGKVAEYHLKEKVR